MTEKARRNAGAYARPPVLPDEPERLAALEGYEILDTPAEQGYDDLTLLAAHVCGTPIALVSLIDADRQWFKSNIGLDTDETRRDVAFCAHAIATPGTMIVADTLDDDRFRFNPLVVDDPKIRFYAGAPLRVPGGHALGTLCVIDRVPRELTAQQLRALEALSRQAVAQLELRRQLAEVKRLNGLLPYCSSCGKLRTDLGDRCPECVRAARR
jgi:GAF domain-containing protein